MKRLSLILAALLWLLVGTAALAEDSIQMTVDPKPFNIDAFFDGATLTVSGTAPADDDIIVRFVGAPSELHMKERGKVLGVIWMNLDPLTFKGVPSVCLVSSAQAFDQLAGGDNPGPSPGIQALRLAGIKDRVDIESNGLDQTTAFNELLKLKKSEGLYGEMTGNVSYGPAPDGKKSFKAEIPLPPQLTPGEYQVEVAAVKGGKVVGGAHEAVTVNLVGFAALLSKLAFGNAALYGVLATIIAIVAGLAIGLVFQSKGAH